MRRTVRSMLAILLCAPAAAAAVDAKSKVKVIFVNQSAWLQEDPNRKPIVDAAVSDIQETVKAILKVQFPYFEWVTSGESAHTLTLQLKQRQGTFDLEFLLEYVGSIALGSSPSHVIYPWNVPMPDPKDLRADLLKKISEDVTKSERELTAYFTSHASIAKRVESVARQIVLPVADIHPETGSFLVDFADADQNTGMIRLIDPLGRASGIYCTIDKFKYLGNPPIDDRWHNGIPDIVNAKARNVTVKVKQFTPKAFANTSGGSVRSLKAGGG